MRSSSRLALRRELMTELAPDTLRRVGAAGLTEFCTIHDCPSMLPCLIDVDLPTDEWSRCRPCTS